MTTISSWSHEVNYFWSDHELVSTPIELSWLRVWEITLPVTVWPLIIILSLLEVDEELVFELLLLAVVLLLELVALDFWLAALLSWEFELFELLELLLELELVLLVLLLFDELDFELELCLFEVVASSSSLASRFSVSMSSLTFFAV